MNSPENRPTSMEPPDPRPQPSFAAGLFPTAEGEDLGPILATDPLHRARERLVFAFYAINVAYQQLVRYRRTSSGEEGSPLERPFLEEIEKAIWAKDAIEDELAPRGIHPFPVLKDGVIIDLQFQDPLRSRRSQSVSSSSIFIQIACLPRRTN